MNTQEYPTIDPALVLMGDNLRFNLKNSKVKDMMEKILEMGGINTPVELEPLPEPIDGCTHRLTVGHYRLTAAQKLNKEKNAGVMLPYTLHSNTDTKERIFRQLSENVDRETMSPMDCAVAIKQMIDAGISKMDIRKAFPRNTKGKKGPASNAWVNMMLTFLEFPKAIQSKIHLGNEDGGIGVATAYELTKVSQDKWEAVLATAEADRAKQLEREEKDETKFLEAEKKNEEAKKKEQEAADALAAARAKAEQVQADLKAKREASIKAYEKAKTEMDEEARKAAEAELKAAEDAAKEVEKTAVTVTREVQKLEGKIKSAAEQAQERAAKLKEARSKAGETPKNKPAGPSATDIKKAAVKEGASKNFVALNASQMREAVQQLTLPGTKPKVMQIFEEIKQCFSGITTPAQMYTKIQKITGEYVDKKK